MNNNPRSLERSWLTVYGFRKTTETVIILVTQVTFIIQFQIEWSLFYSLKKTQLCDELLCTGFV